MHKKYIIKILDIIYGFTILLYLMGGISFGSELKLTYINDLLNICAALGIVFVLLGVDLRELAVSRGFADLAKAIDQKKWPQTFLGKLAGFVSGYLILLFLAAPILRHVGYSSYRWDMGLFEHILWRSTHGLGFSTTIIDDVLAPPRYYLDEAHLTLWLIPASWFYKIIPRGEFLLLLQSLFLISCVIPLWKIAKKLFPPSISPIILPLFLWFTETFHRVNLWDIHENGFIMLPLLWAFVFLLQGKKITSFCFIIAAAFFKEDAWVIAGAMTAYIFLKDRKYFFAILSLFLGMGIFMGYGLTHTIKSIGFADRFDYLGHNLDDAKNVLLHKPFIFIQQLFIHINMKYYWKILTSGGGLWLLGGMGLITMAPPFFEIALASQPAMKLVSNHYIIAMVGPLLFCVALGIKNLKEKINDNKKVISLVSISVLLALTQLQTGEVAYLRELFRSQSWLNKECYGKIISQIPNDVLVYGDGPFASHLIKRPELLRPLPGREMQPGSWAIIPQNQVYPKEAQVVSTECGYTLLRREN